MKPRTKFHQQVVQASQKLPALTEKQIQWAYDNVITHIGCRTKSGTITCTKCGHSWQGEGELINTLVGCDCPNCKVKLAVKTTKKQVFNDCYYMTVITACEGYQVIRTVMVKCVARVGLQPQYTHCEVMQRWITPAGRPATFARLRQGFGACYDAWIFHTALELRQESDDYNRIYTGEVYPRQKLIPELKRTGYKKALYRQRPFVLFRTLLTDSRAETLLKAGQTKILECLLTKGWSFSIDRYWASIRICLRNDYKLKSTKAAILWCDYINSLRECNRDIHNAKYVCPPNLVAEHDKYVKLLNRRRANEEMESERKRIAADREQFEKLKAKFFGLVFSKGDLKVQVLESIEEHIDEGVLMHHCVGSYYNKAEALVFSATVDGKRAATVEVSLNSMKVVQCYGAFNKPTKHRRQIIDLVDQNLDQIYQRMKLNA